MKNNVINILRVSFVVAFALLMVSVIVNAQVGPNSALSLVNTKITPQPVVAGGNFNITFQLYNSYVNILKNVNLQLTGSNPLVNVSPSYNYLITTIGTGLYGGGLVPFTYQFHVPSTLQAGEYTIYVQATYDAVTGSGAGQEDLPGVSTLPINIYIYGVPKIQLAAVPQGQLTAGASTQFTVSAINTGTDTARNVSVRFLNSGNFIPSGSPTLNFGIMAEGSSEQESATLLVASNLSSGIVNIPVVLSYTAQSGLNYSENTSIPISFVTGKPNIVISIASANPAQLLPGTNQTLGVLVQNIGYGTARNLTLKFLDNGALTVTGSAESYVLGALAAGSSATEQVQISLSRNANQTTYSLPISISYSNVSHNSTAKSLFYMPINVQNSAVFNITASYSSLQPGGSYQPLTLKIKNIGNEAAQQVTLSLQTVFPLTPVTPNFYINSLLPGQSANITFFVNTASNGDNGTYPVTLYEQWRQPNGYTTEQYSGSNNYYADVIVGGGLGSYGLYILVAIIVVVGIVAYRRKDMIKKMIAKQKEKNKKQ